MTNYDVAKSKSLRTHLRDEIAKIGVYSSHGHFCSEEDYLYRGLDFSTLFDYFGLVLSAAGLPYDQRVMLHNKNVSEEDKWKIFEPYVAQNPA